MSAAEAERRVDILLVEDNEGDARLTREALKESRVRNKLFRVRDGEEAMAFLRREGHFAAAPRPDLILLDLNLPRKNGREVLRDVKTDERLKHIPVVVLTVSSDDEDILRTYDLHANCYITKPINLNEFLKIVRAVEDFWLTVVQLPSSER